MKKILDSDNCQTPAYALAPLLPFLKVDWAIWECACGDGILSGAMLDKGFTVLSSDIRFGSDFFEFEPKRIWDCIVTNPPYSCKYEWLERCYQLQKPFALLLPLEILGAARAQRLFEKKGIEIILLNRRVNFKMPYKGLKGGGAWFAVAWFTHGLNIGRSITYGKIEYRDGAQISMVDLNGGMQ